MPLDEETTDTLSSTFSSFRFTGAAGEATGIFQRATRIINCATRSRHRATGSTHRATCTAAQLHATVLALQPRVLALQPSVPHLRSFHRLGRLGVGRLLEHLRAPDHLPEPAAHVHRALLRELPPARRTPIPPPHRADAADAAHATPRTTRPVPSLATVLDSTQAEARQHRVPLACARAGPAGGGARGRRADFAAAGHAAVGAAARGQAGTAVASSQDPLTAGLVHELSTGRHPNPLTAVLIL